MFDRINRREVLLAGAASAALAPSHGFAAAPGAEDAKFDALLTAHLEQDFDRSPESVTSLGLDVGARAGQRAQLADRSYEELMRRRADAPQRLGQLQRIDRAKLSEASKVAYDVAAFRLGLDVERNRFGFTGGPYVLSQRGGSYSSLPDWLDTQHPIKTKDDADAYLSRLSAFAVALDQETDRAKRDAGMGVAPPDFILDKALKQLATLRDEPGAQSTLSLSVARRAAAAGIEGDFGAKAVKIVDEAIRPAVARQHAALAAIRQSASADAGVWKFKDGDAYYGLSLKSYTTTNYSAEEIHKIGLAQVAELQSQIDVLLKAEGLKTGTVGERLKALNSAPEHLWPNTEEGRAGLLASLNKQMADLEPLLPRMFATLPKSKVEIRRVPASIEIGAPNGYYQRPSLDGSRPGAFYINLRDTGNWPKWSLPTLTYHEAAPGHHFQIAIVQEAGALPLYRRVGGFSAYSEGWGLYAERVADELGAYADNPLGKVGYLQSFLFRATRLVVDTGLHHKRWTREQAIAWMMDNAAEPADSAESEIDRYIVTPGQACSYKLGELVISRLRAQSEQALGDRFDIRAFHDVVLLNGAVPLLVLERLVSDWTTAQA